MAVPKSHPRYESLMHRERLMDAFKKGLITEAGLIAHGRGEAFDYLLGERTQPEAELAERVGTALLLSAHNPVVSVNGNAAALCPEEIVELSRATGAKLEVNLFYRTEERLRRIVAHLKEHGAKDVLGTEPDAEIPGLEHARAFCTKEGIYSADVILVPLEDGDRAQALRKMGKTTIVIDLNPLSRSSQAASVTIVDELTRAARNMIGFTNEMGNGLAKIPEFNNEKNLDSLVKRMRRGL
jgi:4-phosphopantoate--beta-alanine ligase